MGHVVYRFIEPSRPDGSSLADQLTASLAVTPPRDLADLAEAVSEAATELHAVAGDVYLAHRIGDQHPATVTPSLARAKRALSLLAAQIGTWEDGQS
jgi:hypothetical protein